MGRNNTRAAKSIAKCMSSWACRRTIYSITKENAEQEECNIPLSTDG